MGLYNLYSPNSYQIPITWKQHNWSIPTKSFYARIYEPRHVFMIRFYWHEYCEISFQRSWYSSLIRRHDTYSGQRTEMSQVCKYARCQKGILSAHKDATRTLRVLNATARICAYHIGLWVIRRLVWTQLFDARRAILMNIDVPRHTACSTRGQCISIINTSGHRIARSDERENTPVIPWCFFFFASRGRPNAFLFYFLHTSRLAKLDIN